jgi:molybdate transport system substrate-binding protein
MGAGQQTQLIEDRPMVAAVTVISSMATRKILDALVADYGQAGPTARVVSVGGVDAARRVRAGEAFDLVVLASDALAALAGEGHVIPDSIRTFACSPTAVAVRAGALRPPTCDEAAIRMLVSGTQRIALSTGPSGKSVARLLSSWGLPGLDARCVQAPPGVPVARLLAGGEADVGFQQLSELLGEPGIDIVGTVPAALQPMTVFACGIGRAAADTASAADLLHVFLSDDAAVAKWRFGMEPG